MRDDPRMPAERPPHPPGDKRPPRGRPPRLHREEIIDAARAILRREGVAGLTMRRLAGAVGSAPMGLYHHFADKDELLLSVLEAEAAELQPPQLPARPRDRIVAVAQFIHDVLAARPWVLEAITPGGRFARRTLPLAEEMIAGFVACGLTPDDAARAYRAIFYLIAGELITNEAARRHAAAGRADVNPVSAITGTDREALPTLAELAPRWEQIIERYDAAEALGALVDGFIAHAAGREPAPR